MRKIKWRQIISYVGICLAIAFFFSVLVYFAQSQLRPHQPPNLTLAFLWQAIIYCWAILFPVIRRFAGHFRIERGNWVRTVPAHLVAAVSFVVAHTLFYTVCYYLYHGFSPPEYKSFSEAFRHLFFSNWLLDTSSYFAILSTVTAYDYSRRFQSEKLKTSELKAALADSQLSALKMQLHPHFLFNTLNSISTLLHEDVMAADEMIARLGDFLRLTLENSGEQTVSLAEEIKFINSYLEIESIRFGDRLAFDSEVGAEALRARVPNLILQPIVENAIRHGISRQIRPGKISIRARRAGNKLRLEVEDNGPGVQNGTNGGFGIGLANTRARLFNLYGDDQQLEMANVDPQGLIVRMEIPFDTGGKTTTQ
jgi:two-component system, LytTR family, sensor kinase